MKIVSALGGGGSTFVLGALDKRNYRSTFFGLDAYQVKTKIANYNPSFLNLSNFLMRLAGAYVPQLRVLIRPDVFWTQRANKTGVYNPTSENYQQDLREHKAFIVKTRHSRSAGIRISESDLRDGTLPSLVQSYVEKMQSVERKGNITIVLLSCHWGEYGILKELGLETIYLIRDPYNSLVSHSKDVRHFKDYRIRGLGNINTKEWIDAYMVGPIHYWINHARTALSHDNAIIVRYNHFVEDWQQIKGLPDISSDFTYRENRVTEILTAESIDYICEQTKDICKELGFKTPGRDAHGDKMSYSEPAAKQVVRI
ncbi:MAG: hypothetical protein DRJ03_08265 [Chloroflexi bacterium]|nr:MAG: hypothetical protein DRI81_02950 [Chloroflexota bacterium]RLC86624.1 MAG: hypothetical protein DRJ03_08265 [Chloroflexota bacterium]